MFRILVQVLAMPLPWRLRRQVLQRLLGYRIAPDATIGMSLVLTKKLEMGSKAYIGHLNMFRGMTLVEMQESTIVGNLNWIYAIPTGSGFLVHEPDRRPEIILQSHAAIVGRHLIDCSATIRLEPYSVVSGARTMILTHSADINNSRVRTRPIILGPYSMVGSGSILLGGATLPERSVLGAGSTLRTAETEPLRVYSGVPAVMGAKLSPDAKMLSRTEGKFASDVESA